LTYGTEISKKKKTMKDRNTLEAKWYHSGGELRDKQNKE
jgi:hypothetical protein